MIELRVFAPDQIERQAPKQKRLLPKGLTAHQEARLIEQAHTELAICRAGRPARNYCPKKPACKSKIRAAELDLFLVQFMFGTGLRSEEMHDLRIEHVDTQAQSVFVADGKGSKQRYVPLPDALVPMVRAWIGERKVGYLVTDGKGTQLAQVTLYWRIRRLGRRAGMEVHPHTLRHAFATRIYELTRDLRVVQKLLGHESISTTQIYAECAPSLMLEAVNLKYAKRPEKPDRPA